MPFLSVLHISPIYSWQSTDGHPHLQPSKASPISAEEPSAWRWRRLQMVQKSPFEWAKRWSSGGKIGVHVQTYPYEQPVISCLDHHRWCDTCPCSWDIPKIVRWQFILKCWSTSMLVCLKMGYCISQFMAMNWGNESKWCVPQNHGAWGFPASDLNSHVPNVPNVSHIQLIPTTLW